jgi:hypothetical protein
MKRMMKSERTTAAMQNTLQHKSDTYRGIDDRIVSNEHESSSAVSLAVW